jgi:hypothetical protein
MEGGFWFWVFFKNLWVTEKTSRYEKPQENKPKKIKRQSKRIRSTG